MSTLEHLAYDDGQAEIALLRRMQRGDRDALTALYQRYERRLYAFCHRMAATRTTPRTSCRRRSCASSAGCRSSTSRG